jgi:hypothetical protein
MATILAAIAAGVFIFIVASLVFLAPMARHLNPAWKSRVATLLKDLGNAACE